MSGDVRENRLRRMAERQGLRLEKSRRRDPRAVDFGGYMLIDITTNRVVLGSGAFPYQADLDDVEAHLTGEQKGQSDAAA
jgi:hypothetical protein